MSEIPPFRQSLGELLACDELYAVIVVDGREMPANLSSDRGTQVHDVMWQYINHCVARSIPSDWAALDRFAAAKRADARLILQSLRANYKVDWQHSIGAELKLGMDRNFQPTFEGVTRFDAGSDPVHPPPPRFQVTLDHLLIDENRGYIDDFKTHPGPFEADTIQSHLYPLAALQHFGNIDYVTFRLRFVRYRDCVREVTYSRNDVPDLIEYVQAFAARQVDLHRRVAKDRSQIEAMPGPHCQYCPKLVEMSCPIAEFNEHATHTPQEWLRFLVWSKQMQVKALTVLRSRVAASEQNVKVLDGHGETYEFGNWPTVKISYPLIDTLEQLEQWKAKTGEDLRPKLEIGATGLRPLLKAIKRRDLADEIANVATPETGGKWSVRVAGQDVKEEEEDGTGSGSGA